jgi:methyltransferase OMS1
MKSKSRLITWGLPLAGIYLATAYASYKYFQSPSSSSSVKTITDRERQQIFGQIASNYDKEIDLDEKVTGIIRRRKKLLKNARGKVLEIGAGTGRNLLLYPINQCEKIVAVDASPEMVRVAQEKLNQQGNEMQRHKIELKEMDAHDLRELKDDSFDTVVDTFGLCSYSNPSKVLQEMQRVCKKGKTMTAQKINSNSNVGVILLLEHGRTHSFGFHWLSNFLDRRAPNHAQKWGCWWNRDIKKIVEESGLVIKQMHTYHFGTGYFIVAEPGSSE